MRTSILAALVLIMSIGIAVSGSQTVTAKHGKSILNTYGEKNDLAMLASVEQQTNVTAHIGDLALSGNDVMVVKDARFELNGSLLITDNSTLILDNAVWLPILSPHGNSYTMKNSSQLILRNNSQFLSGGILREALYIYDNALINLTDSSMEIRVYGWPSSIVQMFNSTAYVALDSDARGRSSLLMVNSAGTVGVYGNTEIVNSTLTDLAVSLDARVVDSSIGSLVVRGGSSPNAGYFGPYVKCYLINSTYGSLDKSNFYSGAIYVEWYLTVTVESEGQPVESANVQVYYAHDGSLAAQQTTPSSGQVQFELPEWEITEIGSRYLGDYTVKTSYGAAQAEANVTLTASKDMTVELPKETEPFPTALVIAAIIIATGAVAITLGTIVYRRKKLVSKHSA